MSIASEQLENGEKRSEKFMMYFTPTVLSDFKFLCSMKEISCTNMIFELVCAEIDKNREMIDYFREGQKRLK